MKTTEEVQAVLDIVWRVLHARTDWLLQGQALMAEIEAAVAKAAESRKP
jgi:hypothetical protein